MSHCKVIHGIFVLFWYIWKEKTHSYTIVPNKLTSGFLKVLRGLQQPPLVSRVTKNSLIRQGLSLNQAVFLLHIMPGFFFLFATPQVLYNKGSMMLYLLPMYRALPPLSIATRISTIDFRVCRSYGVIYTSKKN